MDDSLTRRFASKAPPLTEMFKAVIRYRRLDSGEYLFQQGDAASHLYAVIIGRIFITVGIPNTSKEAVIAVILPGQMIGELSMIDGGTRSANARADGSVMVGAVSRDDFSRQIIEQPEVGLRLLTMLSRRLRSTTHHVESLALWDIPARLAKVLLDLAEQESEFTDEGILLSSVMSQKTLASMIGSTREWVNAILHDWQAQETISYSGRHIVIRNPDALRFLLENVEAEV